MAQKYDSPIKVHAPEILREAVERAADHNMTSSSEYARRALLEKLKADGFDPQPYESRRLK